MDLEKLLGALLLGCANTNEDPWDALVSIYDNSNEAKKDFTMVKKDDSLVAVSNHLN